MTVDNVADPEDSTGHILGHKFNDLNGDGTWQKRNSTIIEPGLSNWTMNLYDENWTYLSSAVTGVSGAQSNRYRFQDLPWGTYYVCEVMQDGWVQTRPFAGSSKSVGNLSGNISEGQYCLKAIISYGPTTPGSDTDNEREINMDFGNIKEVLEIEEEEEEEVVIVPPNPSPDPDVNEEENIDENTNTGGRGAGGGTSAATAFVGADDGGGGGVLGTDTTTDETTEDETEDASTQTSSFATDTGEVLAESDENTGSWWSSWWKLLLLLIPLMLLLFFILSRRRKDEEESNK